MSTAVVRNLMAGMKLLDMMESFDGPGPHARAKEVLAVSYTTFTAYHKFRERSTKPDAIFLDDLEMPRFTATEARWFVFFPHVKTLSG